MSNNVCYNGEIVFEALSASLSILFSSATSVWKNAFVDVGSYKFISSIVHFVYSFTL